MLLDSIPATYIDELPEGARIVLYGAGGKGIELLTAIRSERPDIAIFSYADSSKSGILLGLPILSPQELLQQQNNFDLICISSFFWKNIALHLQKLGLTQMVVLESRVLQGCMKPVLISHKHQCLYLIIYRAASSGIQGGLRSGNFEDMQFARINIKDPLYANYFKFSFARNPWDRVLSCYEGKFVDFKNKQGVGDYFHDLIDPIAKLSNTSSVSFETFVQYVAKERDLAADPHWRSLINCLCDEQGNLLVDYLGRFETLSDDFKEVCAHIGLTTSLQHGSASGKQGPYQARYTPELRNLIAERFREDCSRFNYSFE